MVRDYSPKFFVTHFSYQLPLLVCCQLLRHFKVTYHEDIHGEGAVIHLSKTIYIKRFSYLGIFIRRILYFFFRWLGYRPFGNISFRTFTIILRGVYSAEFIYLPRNTEHHRRRPFGVIFHDGYFLVLFDVRDNDLQKAKRLDTSPASTISRQWNEQLRKLPFSDQPPQTTRNLPFWDPFLAQNTTVSPVFEENLDPITEGLLNPNILLGGFSQRPLRVHVECTETGYVVLPRRMILPSGNEISLPFSYIKQFLSEPLSKSIVSCIGFDANRIWFYPEKPPCFHPGGLSLISKKGIVLRFDNTDRGAKVSFSEAR